jgi:hypothetical protein
MRPHDGAVYGDHLPLDVTGGVRLSLERLQDPFPDARTPPAHEAVVAGLPGTVALGQIPPGAARAEAPKDAIEDLAMVLVAAARLPLGSGQQRPEPLVLCVGEISTCHNGRIVPIWSWVVRHSLVLQPHFRVQ